MINVIWITATFLSGSLLAAAANTEKCIDRLDMPIRRITTGGSASVSCPNMTGATEARFELWKGECKIGSVTRKYDQNSTETVGTVDFQDHDENTTARFILSRLDPNNSGVFACNASMLYPPPHRSPSVQNLVIVDEVPQVKACPTGNAPKVWIWVALGVTAAYSLIVTAVAVGLWHHLKNKETFQPDYMNTKPKPRRKKRGVQHPVRTGRHQENCGSRGIQPIHG